MEKDTIITLDDNSMYALLDKTKINGKTYFFAIKLNNETQTPTSEYEIFEEEQENGETYINFLEDDEFKQSILVDFTNKYIKAVEEVTKES